MKTYAIKVHSLKSISRTIGATDVSQIAAALENHAKNADEDEVRSLHPKLLEEYEKTNRAIEALAPQGTDNTAEDDDILEFSPE